MSTRSFLLITYDIVDDRRRLKVAKLMESLGERVQRSVFEVYLTGKELERLLARVEKQMEPEEDSVRVYALCEACRAKVQTLGQGKVTDPPGLKIV